MNCIADEMIKLNRCDVLAKVIIVYTARYYNIVAASVSTFGESEREREREREKHYNHFRAQNAYKLPFFPSPSHFIFQTDLLNKTGRHA